MTARETADCHTTFEELSAKGVTFLQEPASGRTGSKRSSGSSGVMWPSG